MNRTMATLQPKPKRGGNAGRWKAWKTKLRFPPLSTALGNRQRRDFHIPTAPPAAPSLANQNTPIRSPASGASGGLDHRKEAFSRRTARRARIWFQAHRALESKAVFRLIPRWNQNSISGSLLDWKMLGFTTII
jgi:hypothetical protein